MSGGSRSPPVRVVKVGGSLFDWPPLKASLAAWLAEQTPAVNLLLAGGGELTEAIRRADARFGLGDERAHWLCIDAMEVTAGLLAAILAARQVNTLAELAALNGNGCVVFSPREFLWEQEPKIPGSKLPCDWTVTSDSIAARLAEAIQAGELVLLKSQEPPAEDWRELARRGYVDGFFPLAAATLPRVRFVNLRGGVPATS